MDGRKPSNAAVREGLSSAKVQDSTLYKTGNVDLCNAAEINAAAHVHIRETRVHAGTLSSE